MKQGYVHIYTGEGKGKTTASVGVAVRMLASGGRVLMLQFLKGQPTGEAQLAEVFDGFCLRQLGDGNFVMGKPDEETYRRAQFGLVSLAVELASGEWDLVIADEMIVAVSLGLVSTEQLRDVLRQRAPQTEVILTGRGATEELCALADLVTEMKEVKHYYHAGVPARKGIES